MKNILSALFAAVATFATLPIHAELSGNGTAADPYRISSAADWDAFAENIAAGTAASACYRLDADINPVSQTVGTQDHPFSGTFDGEDHTLTVSLRRSDRAIAPFSHISGATIRNLKVAGTVIGAMHCSGLVGEVGGSPNLIESCEVAAAISSTGSHFGGFIGHSVTNAVTLRGCVFSGSLSGGTYVATFHGWSDDGAATTLIDCLDASASAQPIGRGEDAACVSNTYYLADKSFTNGERLWSEGKRGKRAYAVTAGEGVTIDFGAPAATYGTAGITAYANGLIYNDAFYAGSGDVIRLGLAATAPSGMVVDDYVASAGTLSKNGSAWTLTMPGGPVVVNAGSPIPVAEITNTVAEIDYTVKVTKFHQSYPYSGKATIEYMVGGTLPANAVAEIILNTDDASATFVQESIVTGANTHEIDFASSFGGALLLTNASFVVTIAGLGVQLWENGPYWAECNVGASKPEEYGYYFWWGDTVGYTNTGSAWISVKDGTSISFTDSGTAASTYGKANSKLFFAGYIDSTRNLVAAHDAATAHLGSPWRMPTSAEMDALVNNCTTTWITTNGVSGRLVTGKGDYANRSIFLPAAGCGYDACLYYPGSDGYYRSSTPNSDVSDCAWCLGFRSSDFDRFNFFDRYGGFSVRPVRGFAQ